VHGRVGFGFSEIEKVGHAAMIGRERNLAAIFPVLEESARLLPSAATGGRRAALRVPRIPSQA
jgi:hypothetical protein